MKDSEVDVKKGAVKETPGFVPWTGFETPFFRSNFVEMKPLAFMKKFADEMERFFNLAGTGGGYWCPAVEVKEEGGTLRITADLPGVKSDDMRVYWSHGTVVLEGERKQEKNEKREGYYKSERGYGYFYRSIPLPGGVIPDKATAECANGVLEVKIPLSESKNTREIPVKTAA